MSKVVQAHIVIVLTIVTFHGTIIDLQITAIVTQF